MLWLETPTNPNMKVVDIAAAVKTAKSLGDIIVVVDNTFLTPYLQKPLDFGVDIVIYSLTKYMNGHSDVVMGAAVVNDDVIAEKLRFLQNCKYFFVCPLHLKIRNLKKSLFLVQGPKLTNDKNNVLFYSVLAVTIQKPDIGN